MKITAKLKGWLVEQGLPADADEAACRKATATAMADEKLSHDQYIEFTKDPDADRAGAFDAKLDRLMGRLDDIEKRGAAQVEKSGAPAGGDGSSLPGPRLPAALRRGLAAEMDGSSGGEQIRIKSVKEMYDGTRTALKFPEFTTKGVKHGLAGQPAFEGGTAGKRMLSMPSQFDQAQNGAYLRWSLYCERGQSNAGLPRPMQFTEHDKQLIEHCLHESEWNGVLHGDGTDVEGAIGVKGRKLTDFERKALIDDATSGGLEIAPIMFDDAIIQTPLLYGEFYPRVNNVTVTRGRRIEGGIMGTVTLTSGGADNSTIALFNTASFITAFDTTIFTCVGAIELGLDFLSDSPVDVASMVTEQYGRVLMVWLDEQVCIGDGTTEPEGALIASGTTTVNAANGAGGPPTVGDYESLLFGVPKAYKQGFPTDRITYAATETSYQRARAIPVGTTDARRVFGMTHEDYMLFGHPYGIGEFFTNRQILFVNWGRYRMYRRAGLTIRSSSEGKTLMLNNLMLITARARFGGQLEDGGAAAVCTDAQT